MYLGFYGLDAEPFHITPDPEFLFLSPSHKEAFAAVMYGVQGRKGFVLLTGEVGTGKTTVLRACLERFKRPQVQSIYLFYPNVSFEELLKDTLRELGIEADGQSDSWMLQKLHLYLIEQFKQDCNVVLVIDEAQNMPVETLEQLRMLSNLESTKEKLLQIVLVGQPELLRKLERHELRQLKQRTAVRATIQSLTRRESLAYIKHRVAQAGGNDAEMFTPAALQRIIRHAKGNPRTLNVVCNNALVAGFGAQQRPVSADTVREVIADLKGKTRRLAFKWVTSVATMVVVAIGLLAVTSGRLPWSFADLDRPVAPPTATEAAPDKAKPAAILPAPSVALAATRDRKTDEPAAPAKVVERVVPTPSLPTPVEPAEAVARPEPAPVVVASVAPKDTRKAIEPLPAVEAPAPVKPEKTVEAPAPAEPEKTVTETPIAEPQRVAEDLASPESESIPVPETVVAAGDTGQVDEEASEPAVEMTAEADVAGLQLNAMPELRLRWGQGDDSGLLAIPPANVTEGPPWWRGTGYPVSGPWPVTRIVARGDCLTRLVAEVYGACTRERLERVKALNPHIENEDVLHVGSIIVFPDIRRLSASADHGAASLPLDGRVADGKSL